MEERKIISVECIKMIESIGAIPDMTEALKVACRRSRLKEKQIAWELDLEPGQFSRIMSGQAHFPHEKLIKFMDVTGCHIPLQWLAYHCGFELVVMQKAYEEQIKEKEEEVAELKKRLQLQDEFIGKLGEKLKG